MHAIIPLEEIPWCSPPADPGDYYPVLARCDFCYEDAAEDFRDGREPRTFYRMTAENLTVCEHCVEEIES